MKILGLPQISAPLAGIAKKKKKFEKIKIEFYKEFKMTKKKKKKLWDGPFDFNHRYIGAKLPLARVSGFIS